MWCPGQVEVHGKQPRQISGGLYADFLVTTCLRRMPAVATGDCAAPFTSCPAPPSPPPMKSCSACTFLNAGEATQCDVCCTPFPPVPALHDPCREVVFDGTLRGVSGASARGDDVGAGAGAGVAVPASGGSAGASTPGASNYLDEIFGDLGGPQAAGYDLRDGYGSYHQQYWLDGELIAGMRVHSG